VNEANKSPSPRRTFLHLVASVSIALGVAMNSVWALGPRQRRGLTTIEIQLDIERIEAEIRIISAWFRRCKRRGKRYTHRDWRLILEHSERWRPSCVALDP
jgi:hypothetical protein